MRVFSESYSTVLYNSEQHITSLVDTHLLKKRIILFMLGRLDKKFSRLMVVVVLVGGIAIIVTSSRLQETLGVEPCVELERE